MRRISSNSESGAILAIVIILMLALTITGIAFLNAGVMENRLVGREIHKNQAFWQAEAGVEDARFKLGDNWDLASINETPLGEGTYIADIYNTDTEGDLLDPDNDSRRRIRSVGTIKNVSQIVQVIVRQPPRITNIKSALESGGNVQVTGNATITGDVDEGITGVTAKQTIISGSGSVIGGIIDKDPSSFENDFWPYEDYFEEIFQITREGMKDLAKEPGNKYYPNPVKNADAKGITWVDDPNQEGFEITYDGWQGQGILVVDGNMKIVGGTFEGIIWVTGTVEIPAGNPVIRGAMFVESDTDVKAKGTLDLAWDSDAIGGGLGGVATLPRVVFWEQLK